MRVTLSRQWRAKASTKLLGDAFRSGIGSWLAVVSGDREGHVPDCTIWAAAPRIQGARIDVWNALRTTSWMQCRGAILRFFYFQHSGLVMIDLYYWTTP